MSLVHGASHVVQMSGQRCDALPVWTNEHRRNTGQMLRSEMERRALNTRKLAYLIDKDSKTVQRALAGEANVAPAVLLALAEALGLHGDDVLPARSPREQSQLDRIEAKLARIEAIVGLAKNQDALGELEQALSDLGLADGPSREEEPEGDRGKGHRRGASGAGAG